MSTLALVSKNYKTFVSVLFSIALIACGGSGPAGAPVAGGGSSTDGDSAPTYALGVALVDSAGSSTTTVSDITGATVQVTLTASDDSVVANQIISVTSTRGTLFPSSGEVATNDSGVAELSLDVADMEDGEAGTLVAVFTAQSGESSTGRLNFTAAIDPANSVSGFELEGVLFESGIVDESPSLAEMSGTLNAFNSGMQVTTFSSTEPVIYAVRVLNTSGQPVTDSIVTFSSSIGSLSPSSGEALTNSNGVAYVALDASGIQSGSAGEMTAAIGDFSVSKTFAIDNGSLDFGFVANSISVTLEGATNNTISDVAPTNVLVTLSDGDGALLDNEIVSITSTLGSVFPSTGNVATFKGVATAQVDINGVDNGAAGTIVASHTDSDSGVTVSSAINFTAATTSVENKNNIALNILNYTGTTIVDSAPGQFVVTLTDASGGTVPNAIVNASTTIGKVQPSSGNVLTDMKGVANFVLDVTGAEDGEAGVVTVSYSDDNGNIAKTSLNIAANITDLNDAHVMTIALGDTNFSIVDTAPELVTVNLKDAAGAILRDEIINVSATLGMLSPASGNVKTDSSGNAQVLLDVSGAQQGEGGSITASHVDSNGNTVSKTLNYEAVITYPDRSDVLTVAFADGDVQVSFAADEVLNITLTNFDGSEVRADKIISVSTTAGELSANSVVTDANGKATVSLSVAKLAIDTIGRVTVSYTDDESGISLSKSISYKVLANPQINIASYSFESQFYNTSVLTNNGVVALQDVRKGDNLDDDEATPKGSLADFSEARADEVGATVNAVQSSIYAIRLTDSAGVPVEGVVVSFTSTVGAISPSNGKALTNVNGVAYVTVSANGEDPGAAGTISASIDSVSVVDEFAIGSVALKLGYFDAGEFKAEAIDATVTSLTVGGTSSLTINVVKEDGTLFTASPLTINFTSDCSSLGLATLDSAVTTSGGAATATYQLNGCDLNTDKIVATVAGLSGLSASVELSLPQAVPQAIQFISAEPANIALKGTGGAGRQEFSTVVFKVVDESGLPISDVDVDVVLSTDLGNITLTGDAAGDGLIGGEALTTNGDGEVSVRVNAGNVSTAVRVIATVQGQNISTTSDQLVISTGLPDKDSMSLSASILAPGGNDYDGIKSTITIRAADSFNNPIPAGSAVYFTTEYGKVEDYCLMPDINSVQNAGDDIIEAGVCSVVWTSQNPRYGNYNYQFYAGTLVGLVTGNAADGTDCSSSISGVPCPTTVGTVSGGHTTILAYALGEESFVDIDGDGLYGKAEFDEETVGRVKRFFTDLPEAFIDHNGDGVFGNVATPGACTSASQADPDPTTEINECAAWRPGGEFEEFIDADDNREYTWRNGVYNGSLCSSELYCEKQLVYVSDSVELNAGGSDPRFGIYDGNDQFLLSPNVIIPSGSTENIVRRVYITDQFNGRLPAGTTVEITSDNCKLSGVTSFETVDTADKGNAYYTIYLSEDEEKEVKTGIVTVTVTVPEPAGGVVNTIQFNCNDDQ